MNKLFFRLSLLFLIAGIGFVSCSKDENLELNQQSMQEKRKIDVSFDCEKNNVDEKGLDFKKERTLELVDRYVLGEIGIEKQDYDINRQTLALAIALRNQVTSPKIKQYIISKTRKVPSNTINLRELVQENQIFDKVSANYSCIVSQFEELNPMSNFTDFNSFIGELDRVGDHKYNQVIHLFNADNMDSNLAPIFSSNLYINDDDAIIGWQKDARGFFKEVVITEKNVDQITNPIFLMDIQSVDFNENDYQKYLENIRQAKSNKTDFSSRSIKKIVSHRYKDCRDYDHGAQEFHVAATALNEVAAPRLVLTDSNFNRCESKRISKISDSDLCKDLYKWFGHDESFNNHLEWHIWVNYWEYDWNRTRKYLGRGKRWQPVLQKWITVYMFGRRHHWNEWLLLDPGDVDGTIDYLPRLNTEYYIQGGWLLPLVSQKMEIDLWRVD